MKQFFEIKLLVTNLAPEEISFEDGAATLTLPPGMSLAPTAAAAVADDPGRRHPRRLQPRARAGSCAATPPAATRRASATRRRCSRSRGRSPLSAQTDQALRVWGAGDALRVLVDADSEATAGHPYRVRLGLRNISGAGAATAYNASVSIGDGGEGYIFQPRQRRSFGIDAIAPGATYWTDDVILIPERSGLLDVRSSTVGGAAGETVPGGRRDRRARAHPARSASRATATARCAGSRSPAPPATRSTASPQAARTPSRPSNSRARRSVRRPGRRSSSRAGGGPDEWYAVSAIVGGRNVMFHPITQATLAARQGQRRRAGRRGQLPEHAPTRARPTRTMTARATCATTTTTRRSDDEDAPEDDDPLGKPKKDPNCKGEHELNFGPVVAVASCWTKSGSTWTATGRARIGGLDVVPSGQGKVTVDTQEVQLKSSGDGRRCAPARSRSTANQIDWLAGRQEDVQGRRGRRSSTASWSPANGRSSSTRAASSSASPSSSRTRSAASPATRACRSATTAGWSSRSSSSRSPASDQRQARRQGHQARLRARRPRASAGRAPARCLIPKAG